MQALYDLTAPGGIAPPAHRLEDGTLVGPGPWLLEVAPAHRSGRGRWWGGNERGYTTCLDHAGVYTTEELRPEMRRGPCTEGGRYVVVDARVVVGPAVRLMMMVERCRETCPREGLDGFMDPHSRRDELIDHLHRFHLRPDDGIFSPGLLLIGEERRRQIEEEDFTPGGDMVYEADELAYAAMCYVCPPDGELRRGVSIAAGDWPFPQSWWKPGDRERELVKAGAFIAAELDRRHNAKELSDDEMTCGSHLTHWR